MSISACLPELRLKLMNNLPMHKAKVTRTISDRFTFGRGCGAVGRAVTSDIREVFLMQIIVNCNSEKTKINKIVIA